MNEINLNAAVGDAGMERPLEFLIGSRRFCLWSPSLGVSLMLERHIALLGIDPELMNRHPSVEALRIVKEQRKEVCMVLAIASCRSYAKLCDSRFLDRRSRYFAAHLDDDELAGLLIWVLSRPKPETFISLSGIARDQQEQAEIARVKGAGGHTRTFGGKTIFGSLIDMACRVYGWTKQHVVWGIDLVSLRLMLSDAINSVYLSDEEARKCGIGKEPAESYGMAVSDFDKLRAQDWS